MGFFDKFGTALLGAGGSVLNGIGSFVSTSLANKSNQKIAQMVNESNERINNQQIQYNWDMFNAQNAYNSPSAVRQRLSDAGLNPIYYGLDGSSSASGNAFTPIANQQAPPSIPNDFSAFGDAAFKAAQLMNIKADTELKRSSAGLNAANAETVNQVRARQLELMGQQVQLNVDEHELNGKRLEEISSRVDALKQSMDESRARVDDYRSQIGKRQFDVLLSKAMYDLDKRYKDGLLSLSERNLAVSWFNAQTERTNAQINQYNADTNRMRTKNDIVDSISTRQSRVRSLDAASDYFNSSASYTRGKEYRESESFTLDQIQRAANAYISVVDAFFHPTKVASDAVGNVLDAVF